MKHAAFLSYPNAHAALVAAVCFQLRARTKVPIYFYPERARPNAFPVQLAEAIGDSERLVVFVSAETAASQWQRKEFDLFREAHGTNGLVIPVLLDSSLKLPDWAAAIVDYQRVSAVNAEGSDAQAMLIAGRIISLLARTDDVRFVPRPFDDLPTELHARYEKQIIAEYQRNGGNAPPNLVQLGYPTQWPTVLRHPSKKDESPTAVEWCANPLDAQFYGTPRNESARVAVDARMPVERDGVHSLAFPEAGPRAEVRSGNLRVGILVSGGIAPGINAVLSGIVERHEAYSQAFGDPLAGVCEVLGIDGGLPGLCNDGWHPLTSAKMRAEVSKGGSYLTTAREDALLPDNPSYLTEVDRVAEKLHNRDLDILYVVGGEGSMRAAHALWTVYRNKYPKGKLSIVGVPKTMDNDILWVWQSFGFMSAVEKAREIIIQLHTEVRSNPRIAIVQLFGSSSGYVVSHAALGSNVCDLALIPEVSFKMADVCTYLDRVLRRRREAKESPWGLVVMAETAIPEDFSTYFGPQFEKFVGLTQEEKEALNRFQDRKRRLLGQTPDALRSAGLKIVAGAVRYHIDQMNEDNRHRNLWRGLRVLTNEPRHIVRSTPPSVTDVAFGIRLGTMAVDMAMAGYTDCMVSQWLTEFVVVPLKLVVLGRKLVPTDGIFWKTVVSKTGQKEFPGLCGI